MQHELIVPGLDGANPLGFLAALGVLLVLSERAGPKPKLAWRNEGSWRPLVTFQGSRDDLVAALAEDLETWRGDPALDLRYPKQEGAEKPAHDLKPKPARFREYLTSILESPDPRSARALQYAAAFGTETATDNNGNLKPTALHFTAGQQEFLAMVEQLIEGAKGSTSGVGAADFEEALWGPWRYARPLPVLSWDSTASRDYALRASDPSTDKKMGVPGADWLAFRGLALLPLAPQGRRSVTPGCHGGWKDGYFEWPLWTAPIDMEVSRSLLSRAAIDAMEPAERSALGIGVVYRARIRRSDQGGYGSFAPAQVI